MNRDLKCTSVVSWSTLVIRPTLASFYALGKYDPLMQELMIQVSCLAKVWETSPIYFKGISFHLLKSWIWDSLVWYGTSLYETSLALNLDWSSTSNKRSMVMRISLGLKDSPGCWGVVNIYSNLFGSFLLWCWLGHRMQWICHTLNLRAVLCLTVHHNS